MPKQLTLRGVPDEVAERLKALSRERNQSMNATAVELLADALGFSQRRRRLERYVTWERADQEAFDEALRAQRPVDDPAWR
ncbi:MAG: hypothetical protein O7A98_07035 [Acidobacteria bacterium]|nr:hypothetical protein [Acidobacteriota bacterium]